MRQAASKRTATDVTKTPSTNPPLALPPEVIELLNTIYTDIVMKDGLQPSALLLDHTRTLHLAALTKGLVLRAFMNLQKPVAKRTEKNAAKPPTKE